MSCLPYSSALFKRRNKINRIYIQLQCKGVLIEILPINSVSDVLFCSINLRQWHVAYAFKDGGWSPKGSLSNF